MNLGQTVFAQLMDHLPSYEFQKCVTRYRGDAHGRGFSCRDQYLCMAFAQLTYRESLRDIEACLRRTRTLCGACNILSGYRLVTAWRKQKGVALWTKLIVS